MLPGMLTCISFSLLLFLTVSLSVYPPPPFLSLSVFSHHCHTPQTKDYISKPSSWVPQKNCARQLGVLLLSSSAQFMVPWRLSGSQTDDQTRRQSIRAGVSWKEKAVTYSVLYRLASRNVQFGIIRTSAEDWGYDSDSYANSRQEQTQREMEDEPFCFWLGCLVFSISSNLYWTHLFRQSLSFQEWHVLF